MKDLILRFNNDQHAHDTSDDLVLTHQISKRDSALLIGISCVEAFKKNCVSEATEKDVHYMHEMFIDIFGLTPSSVQTLSHQSKNKPTSKNVNKYLNSTISSMKKNSALFVYISGPCCIKDNHCFIPTQDYNQKGAQDSGIDMSNFEKAIQKSKASYIIMILDCDNAEEFAKPVIEKCRNINKHLYVICSSQNFGRSLADEKILKHGYLTFFLKNYLKPFKTRSTVSLCEMVHFLKRYTTPLSRFSYHPMFKQAEQVPALIHRSARPDEVEIDGMLTSKSRKAAKWSTLLLNTRSYREWLKPRTEDARVLLGDQLFSKTELLVHLYLLVLKSFSLLLIEYDKIHLIGNELSEKSLDNMADAIIELITHWLGDIAHESHDKWESYEGLYYGLDKSYVLSGLRQGSDKITQQIQLTQGDGS